MVSDDSLEEIAIHVTSSKGSVEIYGSLDEARPTKELNPTWSSTTGSLTIEKSKHKKFATEGLYNFGIHGLEDQNEYSIVAMQKFGSGEMTPILLLLNRKQSVVVDEK